MTQSAFDGFMMRRAMQLAVNGRGYTSPNPMVGAVVTAPDGRIIGEGWHRQFGGSHAEVNALASVAEADMDLLLQSTVYVTLEPCSHYGKTPPCAELLVRKHVKRVVVGSADPNPKVAGRGLEILREAGIEVVENVLGDECMAINECFMTAHRRRYPFVTLKWAQSADGFLDGKFSGPSGQQIVHARRAEADAIVVGAATVLADNPRLDVRAFGGRSPRPVVLDRHGLLKGSSLPLMLNPRTLHITSGVSLREMLGMLYDEFGYISVLVEGGASVLEGFIGENLWDRAYVEKSPRVTGGKVAAPVIQDVPESVSEAGGNLIFSYSVKAR